NSNHIDPRRFLEDASEIVLERVQCVLQRYDSIKINTVFNGEFVAGDKRANKSIATRNYEIYRCTDQREWYVSRVVEPILASLEEFQERDSGWALSRILNLNVNANKLNPLRAGCHIKLPREIMLKRAVINVQSKDTACFAWSVVAALHPAKKNVERKSSYPHYLSVLNLTGIEFPVTLNQIKKIENLNDISINVYAIEDGIVPIRLADRKRNKHVNLLYVQDDIEGHFALINNLSRLSNCNLNYKDSRCIPVVFHNLTGYDAHFIIKEIATAYEGRVDLLPITKEKYISFTEHVDDIFFIIYRDDKKNCIQLRFIDSYRFLASSLNKLSSFLSKDKLRVLRREFSHLSEENFNLLTRKGVFPYEYIDCSEKLNESCLPPRDSFYSLLTDATVSEDDYAHAVNVWQRFSIQTLGEYSDLYLKTDVLLLADIFENFRDSCIASYGLDPAYYYTLLGFTWDAMLKHTGVKFELLTDIDIVMFVERGIRGGLSQCSNRYARANNKYISSYDSSKPSSYLMYYDVNNLYGWAMCQPLPYADFRWVDNVQNFDFSTIPLDSPTGYILEVDIEYPQHLHDAHTDLPFCPTREKPHGKRDDKLLATLCDKQRYVIHYRNLQQCTRHGLRIAKIHRIL
ncbi:hypothetical protein ALC62_13985, partial [Cyphomyrmex costatus]